ncbi:nitrate reductase subunit alpha [Sediminicurvatus halobius]|uniref:nitrate reductase (quinone) n=1 Tax=Sediminicurvatus halobius TaxID=2182432 RepID=A0A2U2MWU1_9GAMM|nr:nitrate reductase subunit alpha [Spiribacter halobius]PWG61319.1 nitrate reductase subunit alpha [Spiribacter halobius]UEX79696.1 nitrate reductase subunit alpha [Spiribacter halobius]
MSHFLDRLTFFKRVQDTFSGDLGQTTLEDRSWEKAYRQRWQHDKIVRSTHGVNCTGACSWKIYVKDGLVTWETQQTDYPRTRPGLPNHEPRGCARGASYSWYMYSANRLKYPMVRGRLLRLWREARKVHDDPVAAWESIVSIPEKADEYKRKRGLGGLVRADWDEVEEMIAAANVYTARDYGPDRIIGFSPIPAMSMVSYAAGARYLSLIGGACLSFYDWYCDLPPSSPMTWGEQTDVPESADWYNAKFLMMWGSNVPQTRTPDAHFMTEARYNGTKTVVVSPDYAEATKFGDLWLSPKQGTDAALGMALGHVILKEFHVDRQEPYFTDYCRRYTDMPLLVELEETPRGTAPGRFLRASDLEDGAGQKQHTEWKTLGIDGKSGDIVCPRGSIGFRWDESGRWNLEQKEGGGKGRNVELVLSLADGHDELATVAFPYFGGIEHEYFTANEQQDVLERKVPVRRLTLADGREVKVATVFDLMAAHYGVDRGFEGDDVPKSYEDDKPYTPAWQERITSVPAEHVIRVAREFADNAAKTNGKSMVILGAGLNHWYHMDMNYRAIINMLVMCGCIGQSGGGWAHYVGQEKLRPQTGWLPVAFALDWARPPRHMNGTSFWYAHSDQWRYEKLEVSEILSPLADPKDWGGSMIDYNVRAERMGWLPSAPQLGRNPLQVARDAAAAGMEPKDYVVEQLKSGELRMACEDPDNPANFPRNLFIWRSNLLGSSGKGHEYLLKHLLGTDDGVQEQDLGDEGFQRAEEVVWRDEAPRGKLDLLVTLDFRMSTTCLYSDIVLPTATWYEKNDLNTSDMHPFIHPLSEATDPAWEARSDWDIFKGLARKFSEVVPGHLGVEKDVVTVPLLHDTPGELGQPFDVKDWKRGECDPVPGKTMPNLVVVERDYPNTYERFTSVGPLLDKLGNGGKGISWNTESEVDYLGRLHGRHNGNGSDARPSMDTATQAADTIMSLAPETNGHVAVKAWEALGRFTGRDHRHLALSKEHEHIGFRDIVAQPRKIISSPTWSGIESEEVCYNAGWTNVHELIPWRTLTGRQQFYQDHSWMRAFGEGFVSYRPPVNTKTWKQLEGRRSNGNPELVLNWITPHQKWGIHSTYSDNLLMLTLSRGGPCIWISEVDAKKAGIEDNDWIEVFNVNGAVVARAVVSQRVREGMAMMYHAQERIVNTPGSEITGKRGGIHNSVTRAVLKPTHMIGGYAQLSYGFNYYGTVGSNRDEFVVARKMSRVDWLEGDDESILAQEYTR